MTKLPPLTESIPNLPEVEYAKPLLESSATKVTTLANGLRVASEPRFGQFCTVGLVIDSGPRYEVTYPSGVSHFLEKLAFNVSSFSFLFGVSHLTIFLVFSLVDHKFSQQRCHLEGTREEWWNM